MSTNDTKMAVNKLVTSTGVISIAVVSDEDKTRFVVTDANSGNTITVSGRITGQTDWDLLQTITGNYKGVVDVRTYDQLKIECTVFDAPAGFIKVVASSFNEAGGSTTIDAPTGGTITSEEIIFTSSDSSIDIVADPGTGTIDFIAVGLGGSSKYVKTVVLGDWTGPSLGEYTLNIPFSFHGKANPIVVCYETAGSDFEQVQAPVIIDSSSNVSIKVLSSPDTRFVGKIYIN